MVLSLGFVHRDEEGAELRGWSCKQLRFDMRGSSAVPDESGGKPSALQKVFQEQTLFVIAKEAVFGSLQGMEALMIILLVIVVLVVLVGIWLIAQYNGLVGSRNRYRNGFAQIDVQLKRRHDLIPNLVETAKSYMKHEKDTLEAVIAARNSAADARSGANPESAEAVAAMAAAEGGLGGSLGRLFALSENYPELRSNQNMLQLQEELTSTENKVGFSRQAYNDAVTSYNTKRESFPTSFIAGMFNFGPAVLFEVSDAEQRDRVDVKFD